MSTIPNSGGPAFPQLNGFQKEIRPGPEYFRAETTGGMTLRDYFAGQALIGLLSSEPINRTSDAEAVHDSLLFAQGAYLYADAMLAARQVKTD